MKNQSSSKPKVGLVGYGYWGPNLLRNLVNQRGFEVIGVVDTDPAAQKRCAEIYPQIPIFSSLDDCLKQGKPDAMVIATPPASHRNVAVKCLSAGAHILIEKPLGLSVAECDDILELADSKGLQVMVDHTFAYHPAIQRLDQEVKTGAMGDLLYYDSVRVNLGGFQPRTNVLWDLAPHDLSILDLLTGGKVPSRISAVGIKHFNDEVENLCYVTMTYENNFVAHLHLNWVAPVKVRTIMVGGTRRMAIYDDNLPTEKIKIYDKGVTLEPSLTPQDFRVNYRVGDMIAPAISTREALTTLVSKFLECVTKGERTISDGQSGRRIVEILEAAALSLARGGEVIDVKNVRAPTKKIVRVA
jgi:predicted dehydrogenase